MRKIFFHVLLLSRYHLPQKFLFHVRMSSPDEISRIREENFEKAVRAVCRDVDTDIDALKGILDVIPEFNTMFFCGYNLLYISCNYRNKKVFEYLLNLNCFDLEAVDHDQNTVLAKMITIFDSRSRDYYCVKLINAGADVFKIDSNGRTYLHNAMNYYSFETAKLLLQKGVDPNAQGYGGYTSLHRAMTYNGNPKVDECVGLLLEYGADTSILDNCRYLPFDSAVISGRESIQEHLFYCTFDSHSADYKMQSDVLDKLLDAPVYDNVSRLFDNVMDFVSDVNLKEYFKVNFFIMPSDLLKKFVEKYGYIIRRAFSEMKLNRMAMNINNLEILLNCELHFETAELISKLNLRRIYLDNLDRMSQEELSSLILYLLSHGLNVTSDDCQEIYDSQGHSDFFKTMLLHLDYTDALTIYAPMIKIIVDIHCDLNAILARFDDFSCYQIEPLLDYFANSELRLRCKRTGAPNLVNKVGQLPTVPSLLQLARDEIRRHIVRRLKLKKSSQYYWVLRRLFFSTAYEEILSFETKLYGYHK